MTEEAAVTRSRVQVTMSPDLLLLVQHVGGITGESDSQVVLRGLMQALPDMIRGADEFNGRFLAVEREREQKRIKLDKQRADFAAKVRR
jgi:hypothetical protein